MKTVTYAMNHLRSKTPKAFANSSPGRRPGDQNQFRRGNSEGVRKQIPGASTNFGNPFRVVSKISLDSQGSALSRRNPGLKVSERLRRSSLDRWIQMVK